MTNKKQRSEVYWLAFTASHDEKDAVKIFVQRFGFQPEKIFTEKRVLWLGPISREVLHA